MKKILAFIMVALLIFCMASCGKKDADNADATKDTTPTINNPTIEIESGTLEVGKNADGEYEIVGYTHKNEALVDLKLPDKLDEVDIVGIASRAFTADSTIKTVTIPATYEYVGKQAFFQCSALTSVTMADSITDIREAAFKECDKLSTVVWSKSLSLLGESAFEGCKKLTSADLSGGITVIGNGAFLGCDSLTDVTLSDKLISVNKGAFMNCGSLKLTEFDNGLYLGNKTNPHLAFISVTDLNVKECTVNDNTKIIATNALANCNGLNSVTLGKSVTCVSADCFTNSPYIDYVMYDDTVNYLKLGTAEDAALAMISVKKTAVETLTVHENTAIITDTALAECSELSDISYAKTSADWNKITKSATWNHDLAITIHCANNEKITTN